MIYLKLSKSGKEWSESGYMLKEGLTIFAEILDVEYKRINWEKDTILHNFWLKPPEE